MSEDEEFCADNSNNDSEYNPTSCDSGDIVCDIGGATAATQLLGWHVDNNRDSSHCCTGYAKCGQ